jgi:hypothetical protein
MYASKTVLHLLITALLVVPAVCCGGSLQSVPQMQSLEMLGDCPGHVQRSEPASQGQGCSGCVLTEATMNSTEAWDEDRGTPDLSDFPVDLLHCVSLATFVDVGPAVAECRYGTGGRPDTPVTLFDRLLLPS